jgi:hypothetical protein
VLLAAEVVADDGVVAGQKELSVEDHRGYGGSGSTLSDLDRLTGLYRAASV